MKKFILIAMVALMKMMVIKCAYGMSNDDKDKQGIIRTNPPISQMANQQGELINTSQPSLVRLEEGISQDNIEVGNASMGRRLLGYTVRCGSIAGCTLIGSLIGYGVVAGELSPGMASAVVKVSAPILIGGSVGYLSGWISGNVAKAKITGKM